VGFTIVSRANVPGETCEKRRNNNNNNNNNTKNLNIEIHRMWNIKCFVIPVIIGAAGIVTEGLKKYLETI
jgi:hypothetical protein